MYSDYRMNDTNVQDYEQQEQIIQKVSDRFITYGYHRIKTSAFEKYDLYSKVNSSINRNEMIKVIDHTGQVLVLRPDVTIPITQQLAQDKKELTNELRYFYVQDVFRQPKDKAERIERTQAGVEYFSESSPEADAEVIALAIHVLRDLGFRDIKIELGHAGYVKELIDQINIDQTDIDQLKGIIQAKNIVEMDPFLRSLSIETEWRKAIKAIPFLYGAPADVIKKAREISFTENMGETLDYLSRVYETLKMYDLEKHIVMDLGLINDMGYYTDIIFQGYVEEIGKPIIMGGRYNDLGDRFGSSLPAIGFACDIDTILETIKVDMKEQDSLIDFKIVYNEQEMASSIKLSNRLREKKYRVISIPTEKKNMESKQSIWTITIQDGKSVLYKKGKSSPFTSFEELLTLIEK